MTRLGALGFEKLVQEDGMVSAAKLPFDEEKSQVAFETATFGLG